MLKQIMKYLKANGSDQTESSRSLLQGAAAHCCLSSPCRLHCDVII